VKADWSCGVGRSDGLGCFSAARLDVFLAAKRRRMLVAGRNLWLLVLDRKDRW
jgi:hypothetical protein